ncbi:hypothetical protein C2845_PM04G06890 [Panicum miliaceum]|uniref:Uncharacterized protein n=1 Tax=Panicum miliaceum TaxID=4540 RepID=A0A3L6QLQ6_PANMI|nr:hypothetical protein C2845_PM04G06890 [Panicum miliaceum]
MGGVWMRWEKQRTGEEDRAGDNNSWRERGRWKTKTLDFWLQLREGLNAKLGKGFDSIFMLVSWRILKERNGGVFGRQQSLAAAQLTELILEDGRLWVQAGAKLVAALGWPDAAHS